MRLLLFKVACPVYSRAHSSCCHTRPRFSECRANGAALAVRCGWVDFGLSAHGGEAPHIGTKGALFAPRAPRGASHSSLDLDVGVDAVCAAMPINFSCSETRRTLEAATRDPRTRIFDGGLCGIY